MQPVCVGLCVECCNLIGCVATAVSVFSEHLKRTKTQLFFTVLFHISLLWITLWSWFESLLKTFERHQTRALCVVTPSLQLFLIVICMLCPSVDPLVIGWQICSALSSLDGSRCCRSAAAAAVFECWLYRYWPAQRLERGLNTEIHPVGSVYICIGNLKLNLM